VGSALEGGGVRSRAGGNGLELGVSGRKVDRSAGAATALHLRYRRRHEFVRDGYRDPLCNRVDAERTSWPEMDRDIPVVSVIWFLFRPSRPTEIGEKARRFTISERRSPANRPKRPHSSTSESQSNVRSLTSRSSLTPGARSRRPCGPPHTAVCQTVAAHLSAAGHELAFILRYSASNVSRRSEMSVSSSDDAGPSRRSSGTSGFKPSGDGTSRCMGSPPGFAQLFGGPARRRIHGRHRTRSR